MDWNGNGKQDGFDTFMDMKLINGELDGKNNGRHSGGCLSTIIITLFAIGLISAVMNFLFSFS